MTSPLAEEHLCHNDLKRKSGSKSLTPALDEVGEDESHPLTSLMKIVGVLIEKYEDDRIPELAVEKLTLRAREGVNESGR